MSNTAEYGKSGGWSKSGNLRNNNEDNCGTQANFLERDNNQAPSKNYTVQFSVGVPKNADGSIASTYFINPVGEIKWSVEGGDVRRVVSVSNGLSITGVGEGVKVVIRDKTPVGIAVLVSYDVGITIAPGSRASENQPPTYCPTLNSTEGMVIVPSASTFDVLIPENAGVISAYITAIKTNLVSPLAPLNARVDQVDAAGVIVRAYDPNSQYPTTFVPIMPTARKLVLANNLAGESNDIAFAVTFGIDG